MNAEQAADAEAAAEALSWELSTIAGSAGYPDSAQATMMADIDAALAEADSAAWFGYDPHTFWSSIVRRSQSWSWDGADKVRAVVAMGPVLLGDAEAQADAESLTTQLGGTVAGAVEDVGEVGDAAVTAAKSPSSWFWLAVAGVAVVVLTSRR